MTSSDAPSLLNDRASETAGAAGSAQTRPPFSRRELLARMRREPHGRNGDSAADPVGPAGQSPPAPTPLSQPRILDATEACLREFGYDGTTIRRIAGRLECAVGTIYRHFTDKRTLLDGVTQRRFEPVAERVEQGEDIRETAALYLRTAATEPQQYRLMFWLASVGDPDKPGVPAVVQRILRGWADQLGDERQAQRFWAQIHGTLMLGLTPDPAQITAEDLPVPSAVGEQAASASSATGHAEDMTLL
ncbi:MAG: TetR/AcrR family transcriptional regulator [Phycisphaeraceae bacterium]